MTSNAGAGAPQHHSQAEYLTRAIPASIGAVLEALLAEAPMPALYLDCDLIVRWANQAATILTQPSHRPIANRPIFEVFPTARSAVEPLLRRVLARGQPEAIDGVTMPSTLDETRPTYWFLALTPVLADDGAIAGIIDIGYPQTRQMLTYQQVEHQRRRFQTIINTLPISVFIWSADGQPLLFNASADHLWSRIGQPAASLTDPVPGLTYPDGQPVRLRELIAANRSDADALNHGQVILMTCPNGATEPLVGSGLPLRGADGKLHGYLLLARDPRPEWEHQRLAERAQSLEAVADLRSQLLAFVSHELRTPLSHIVGYTDALRKHGPTLTLEAQDDYLAIIGSAAAQLGRLIDDLLDASQIESGGLSLLPGSVDMPVIAARVRDHVRHLNPAQRLALRFPATFPPIPGDPGRIEQVLENLIDNARQHAPGAAITVGGRARRQEVEVWVRDTGPGFQGLEMPDAFAPLTGRRPAHTGGLGLGLPICRGIVEAHGGRIWLEPRQRGAAVHFTLPRRRPAPPARATKALA